ncbi:MAG: hypothetical protein ACK56F_00420, partial [bacterium]
MAYLTGEDGPYADHTYVEGSGIIKTGPSYYDENGEQLARSEVEDLGYTYQNNQVVKVDESINESEVPEAPDLPAAMASAPDDGDAFGVMAMRTFAEDVGNDEPDSSEQERGDDRGSDEEPDSESEADDIDEGDEGDQGPSQEIAEQTRSEEPDEDVGTVIQHFLEELHGDDSQPNQGDGEPNEMPIDQLVNGIIALNAEEAEAETIAGEEHLNLLEESNDTEVSDVEGPEAGFEPGGGDGLPDTGEASLPDSIDDLGDDAA